ncbi:uncharacterized protein ALTATR162_LOCUS2597 [Alternaria atra]|uniref:Uncharacterized protein n=1 Tax=Alternaria atra TaxID=119953 RepID=A0A8J2N3F9_9PLEO|nr:uncharacterized protein ALTATR162_LOCUS2597 [Alternaria atra]CAG5150235.1 unnamed protein product [Alternaria atra]
MNVNADTNGLLKALLKLDEADRGHIVEHLPPDKVKNALLLLLREKDGVLGTSDIATFGELTDSMLPLLVLQKQPLAQAPLAIHPVSTHEPVTISNKQGNSAATFNNLKRAKTDAAVTQNAEEGAAQIVVRSEHETIEIASDDEEPGAEASDQSKIKKLDSQLTYRCTCAFMMNRDTIR